MIELKHIERFYPLAQGQFFCVLRDVNLKIEEGDFCGGRAWSRCHEASEQAFSSGGKMRNFGHG